MGRLYDQVFDTVIHGAVQCRINIVNQDAIAPLNMVDNNVCGKASSDRIIRESCFQIILDCTDGQATAVVEAGAEAEDKKLVFTDVILIADIVQRSITGIVVLLIFSEGDLCDEELYDLFIQNEYQGVYSDRLAHVQNMINRLQAEQETLERKLGIVIIEDDLFKKLYSLVSESAPDSDLMKALNEVYKEQVINNDRLEDELL